jgi:cell wall-associated NlpC family hydrolase
MLPAMRFSGVPLSLFLSMLVAAGAHAAPSDTGASNDDMDRFLADKGLMTQIEQVRQSVSHKASELVVTALGFLGVPYRMGGNTVETGFDCSGFVRAMYQQTVGLILPRKAEQQAAATEKIERGDLRPGDLVFFNTLKRAFSHVGIYVGEGKFIHSPKPGGEVRVENMGVSYWNHRFDGARRVSAVGGNTAAPVQPTPASPLFPVSPVSPISPAAPLADPFARFSAN